MFKTLSVLVPVYNEKDNIKECLNRILKANTCGLELEIIVSANLAQVIFSTQISNI